MSRERLKQECWRKKKYRTRVDANRVRAQQEANGAPPLSIYSCEHCGRYHLTKHPRQKPPPPKEVAHGR